MPKELDDYIENARRAWNVPGLSVTIVKDGKLLAAKGYGVRELGKDAKVDENTMFDLASITKSFTAAAIATLVDEGKIRWDDLVRRHLPAFELSDDYRSQNVTIRDLLAHRVGMERGDFLFWFAGYDTAEVVRRMRYLEVREPFRSTVSYSNVGYAAVGEAAAAAAGMSYVDLVRTRLLEPLGMRDTMVGVEHTLAANHASPHSTVGMVSQPIRNKKALNINPAAGVNSTPRDIAKWLLFQLGDGTWEGKRVISAEGMAEMHTPQAIIATTPQMRAARGVRFFAGYGLGWQIMDFHGHPIHWHTGGAEGMPTYMAILPEEKIGVAVFVNTWAAPTLHLAIAARVLDTLLGTKDVHDSAREALEANRRAEKRALEQWEATQKARVMGTNPSRPIESYAGTYDNKLYGAMLVSHVDGKLTLRFAGGEIADLTHWNYDTFQVTWRDRAYEGLDTFVTFQLDRGGNPHKMEMPLGVRDTILATRVQPSQ